MYRYRKAVSLSNKNMRRAQLPHKLRVVNVTVSGVRDDLMNEQWHALLGQDTLDYSPIRERESIVDWARGLPEPMASDIAEAMNVSSPEPTTKGPPRKNANLYFRRKTSEVMGDKDSKALLCEMYDSLVVDRDTFDARGQALARLTAANLCEIGAKVVHITIDGCRLVEVMQRGMTLSSPTMPLRDSSAWARDLETTDQQGDRQTPSNQVRARLWTGTRRFTLKRKRNFPSEKILP